LLLHNFVIFKFLETNLQIYKFNFEIGRANIELHKGKCLLGIYEIKPSLDHRIGYGHATNNDLIKVSKVFTVNFYALGFVIFELDRHS
jgi:hypothetical protein